MATSLAVPARDKASGKWRIVALHIDNAKGEYFGMITEESYDDVAQAATLCLAMQVELKKTMQPEQVSNQPNRKARRAMKANANE